MNYSRRRRLWCVYVFWSWLCILLLSACGENTMTPSAQGNSVSNSSFAIQVQSNEEGLRCQIDYMNLLPNALVLDTDQRNFDDVTIQQLGQYVSDASSLTSVPHGFRTRPIGIIDPQSKGAAPICNWALQITNVGDNSLQVEKIQMQFHSTPQKQPYHLINICSLPLTRQIKCPPTGRGAGPADFTYNFDIGKSITDRVVPGVLKGGYDPTLAPGNTLQMLAVFTLPPGANVMTYQIMPLISMSQSGKVLTQAIANQRSSLALVTTQKQECYTLQGDTFVLLPSAQFDKAWCL